MNERTLPAEEKAEAVRPRGCKCNPGDWGTIEIPPVCRRYETCDELEKAARDRFNEVHQINPRDLWELQPEATKDTYREWVKNTQKASEPHKRVWTGPGHLEETGYIDPTPSSEGDPR